MVEPISGPPSDAATDSLPDELYREGVRSLRDRHVVLVACGLGCVASAVALLGAIVDVWWLVVVAFLGIFATILVSVLLVLRRTASLAARMGAWETAIAPSRAERFLRTAELALGRGPTSIQSRVRHDVIRDTSALLTLHDLYPTPGEHVPLTSWSAYPATALMLTEHVRELPAGSAVLELGSGATTVWMALASRRRGGDVRIVSLEASADFAEVTRTAVRRNAVDDLVDLRVAALDEVTTKHGAQQWYEAPAWNDLTGIGLLFIDGPPGGTGPNARYPAVELLAERLAPGAVVVIDDADRDDEKAMLADWLALERDGRHPEIIEVRENATALRMP